MTDGCWIEILVNSLRFRKICEECHIEQQGLAIMTITCLFVVAILVNNSVHCWVARIPNVLHEACVPCGHVSTKVTMSRSNDDGHHQ